MDGLAWKLEDLADDILCLILVFCDIYTVLFVSRVNKSLRRIGYSKQIWIYLIHDLAARGLFDLPHDRPLQEYSTVELIEEVQRIVLGPKTWSRPRRAAPLIAREFRIPSTRLDDLPRLLSVQLLPRDTHLVVEYTSRIDLWHVAASAVIWFVEDNWMTRVCRYSIQLCDDQRSAILVTLDTPQIFKVEPPTQEAQFGCRPVISGDFFGCKKTVIINYNPYAEVADWFFPLAADHIFFTARRGLPPHNQWLYAFPLKDCFTRSATSISIDDRPMHIAQELPLAKPYCTNMVLYISPLRHDTSKLLLYIAGYQRPKPPRYSLKGMHQMLSTLFKNKTTIEPDACALYYFHFSLSTTNTIVNLTQSSSAGFSFAACHHITERRSAGDSIILLNSVA
ncbi:hypothetical protein C8J57DRAFT_1321804 [Mycena rebaudengoi]|nr:hypothetical protein C8J57DRAFT_1321804 [Mycena rebaudengoi]